MSKAVFALANVLYRNFFPVYRFTYYIFKRKQDTFEISLLKKFIKPGDVVLDIGANIGFYSELLASIVMSHGEVHSFEPDPVNFGHLKKSCKGKANIFINNLAISNQPGELKLFTSSSLNVDHRTYPIDDYGASFTVKAESVDNYLGEKKVDFIKMDIQGAEFFAFSGMSRTFDANPDITILSEFWPFGLKASGTSLDQFQKLLKDKGFLFYLVQDEKLIKINDLLIYDSRPETEYFNLLLSRKDIL